MSREAIWEAVKSVLSPEGFRARSGTFYRTHQAISIDVVNLQAGTGHLAGKETVNLGVYIPEVARLLAPSGVKNLPKEYECQIRIRLSRLAYGDDRWFDRSLSTTPREISSLIAKCAMPFFAEFPSLEAIAMRAESGSVPQTIIGPGLHAAVLVLLDKKEEARSVLIAHRDEHPVGIDKYAAALKLTL